MRGRPRPRSLARAASSVAQVFTRPAVTAGLEKVGISTLQPRRILVIADENLSGSLRKTLEGRGFAVNVAAVRDDLNQEVPFHFDLVVVDLDTGRASNFIEHVRTTFRRNGTPILALGRWGTGQPTLALSSGADAYEPTPIDSKRLTNAVERLLNQRAAVVGMSE